MENKTIAQQLGITKFPFIINDDNGKQIYGESFDGDWWKYKYDSNGKQIYSENSDGVWSKHEYNSNGKYIYGENYLGYWEKYEYDENNNQIYFENSDGEIDDKRPKVVELSINEIAEKLGIDTKFLKIVDK